MEKDGSERFVGRREEGGNKEVNKGKENVEKRENVGEKQPQYPEELCSFWMNL